MMRPELAAAEGVAWRRLARPGTWWTGAERLSIARETRLVDCRLCATRKAALVPVSIHGTHDIAEPTLPAAAIEAIHRIRTNSGRISERWFDTLRDGGLSSEAFVELVSIVAVTVAVDTFRRASGLPLLSLSAVAEPSAPSGSRPAGAKSGLGWIPTLAPEDVTDADPDLYLERPGPRRRYGANIHRALSGVPASMIHWWDLLEELYQSSAQMRDYAVEYRAISHPQIELLAARVASLNRCEY